MARHPLLRTAAHRERQGGAAKEPAGGENDGGQAAGLDDTKANGSAPPPPPEIALVLAGPLAHAVPPLPSDAAAQLRNLTLDPHAPITTTRVVPSYII